mmetsp:Transcript_44174/g.102034  ORF Transcript_44174/g.102034 Transcript_44174/m.102034 type:complete len:368 (-) Transcript_44174:130-1233(-)
MGRACAANMGAPSSATSLQPMASLAGLLTILPAAAGFIARQSPEDGDFFSDRVTPVPPSPCKADLRYDNVCASQPRWSAFGDPWKPLRRPRQIVHDSERLKRDFWAEMGSNARLGYAFYETWMKIFDLQAVDLLATKETWTADDTRMLSDIANGTKLVGVDGSEQEITTEHMIKLLPRVRDLDWKVYNGNLAIVGNGADLANSSLGAEIDSHSQVVRFNNLVDARLNRVDTGLKQTMHVVNANVEGREDLPVFDLEFAWPGRAWCSRLLTGGRHLQRPVTELYMFRPTGFCRMPKDAASFSRGFLFFWLYGSLWKDPTLYGFADPTGHHYDNKKKVHEPFLLAEHALYRALAKQTRLSTNATLPKQA